MQMHSKPTQRKLASQRKTSRGKVSRRNLVTIIKKKNLEAKKKGLQLIAVITPPVINLFS